MSDLDADFIREWHFLMYQKSNIMKKKILKILKYSVPSLGISLFNLKNLQVQWFLCSLNKFEFLAFLIYLCKYQNFNRLKHKVPYTK